MADRLICMESNRSIRAFEDPVLLDDERVLGNLLLAEEKYVPQSSYFGNCVQTDIKPYMRRMVTEWMGEVCMEQSTEPEVYPLAVNYLDRFLSVQDTPRTKLQCLGAACMLLASKLKENFHISSDQLVIYTDHSITISELKDMESTVLQVLKWDLSAITPCDFVAQLVHRLHVHPTHVSDVTKHAHVFIKFCVTDDKFMLYTPSMVAAGCVAVAALMTNAIYPTLVQSLLEMTGIDPEVFNDCHDAIKQIVATHLNQYTTLNNLDSTTIVAESHVKGDQPIACQSTTPTDVRDINLVTVETQNQSQLMSH